MIETDVTAISQLFGLQKDIVEASEKDGTLSVRITDALKKNYVSTDTFNTFKGNHKTEVETNYFNDLVEKAKKQDIPQDLYKPVKGAVLQQLEREYAKKFDVKDFQNFDDLIEKATSKTSANGKTLPEYETKIKDLQDANLKLKKEAEDAVKNVETKFKTQSIERDLNDFVNKVPHDFSSFKPEEMQNATLRIKNILKSVFAGDGYKLDYNEKGIPIVMDKEGKVLKNSATLEPLNPVDVMTNLAKDYGQLIKSSDRGGQGGQSSQQGSTMFQNLDAFLNYCESKGIQPTSKEGAELLKASGLKLF
jgi:hypothetical protein